MGIVRLWRYVVWWCSHHSRMRALVVVYGSQSPMRSSNDLVLLSDRRSVPFAEGWQGYAGSPDEYRGSFSLGPKKTSYSCKTERQVWDDTKAVHIRTVSTWSKNKKYSWHDKKLFGLLYLYHPSVEMTRRAVAATPPDSWTAIISKTDVIRCI